MSVILKSAYAPWSEMTTQSLRAITPVLREMHTQNDSKYVDVTARFFDAVKQMEPGKVKLTTYFDMLEGARALEMGNSRLDTGLLDLSEEELSFDATAEQSFSAVVSIMNKLFVLYMSWLSGSSLSVTVLSCRYMLDFLQNYRRTGSLKETNFINPRLHSSDHDIIASNGSRLVNTILRAFVIGMSKTIGFSLHVATSVLYDEEDLVTRSMGFDFLTQISPQVVCAEIEEAELWLRQQSDLEADSNFAIATKQLMLIKSLVRLEDVIYRDIELFGEPKSWGLAQIDMILEVVSSLSAHRFTEVPAPAFSRLVQLDCDNKHLPSNNVEIGQVEAYSGMRELVSAIDKMIRDFTSMKNVSQLQTYLRYNVGFDMASDAGALTRGIFQLFFIRDDRSVVGSSENLGSITTRLLDTISLCGNTIMNPTQWNIQNTKDPQGMKADCFNKMSELLNDLEAASLHKLGSYGNNRSRQRQINNKSILLWDSLHFNAETIEAELFNHGIGDKLSAEFPDQPAFGISSYIFLEKLDTMIDVAFSGFELELYNLDEAPVMYWFISGLCSQAYELITERIIKINNGKLMMTQSLSKKIKGTKAGPKKEALKLDYIQMRDHVAPVLTKNVIYLRKYSALSQLCFSLSALSISMAIDVLTAACNPRESSSHLASAKQLYDLRMKPWSSVGVPQVPKYEAYLEFKKSTLNVHDVSTSEKNGEFLRSVRIVKAKLDEASSCCEELCRNLDLEPAVKERTRIGGDCKADIFFIKLKKTCLAYKAQLSLLETRGFEARAVKRVDGCLPYFPVYSLTW